MRQNTIDFHQTLPIAKYVYWCSESFLKAFPLENHQFAEPDVSFLPLMQRRRLNFLSKIFFHVVNVCEPSARDIPIVFGSRYGELPRTMNILKSLGINEPISPTDFSHSVHNTPVALYSIFAKSQQPVNAIAAGEDTFMATLLETTAQFHSSNKDVLLVFAEDKLPDPYTRSNPEESELAYGIALLVSAEKPKLTLAWQKNGPLKKQQLQIASFIKGIHENNSSFHMNAFGNEYLFEKVVHDS